MYESIVSSIQEEASRLSSAQRKSLDRLQQLKDDNGNAANFAKSISDGDRSLSDIDTLTSSLIKFVEGFREDRNWAFVPRVWITEFRDALKNTANSFDALSANLNSIDDQHGGLSAIDPNTLAITAKNGTLVELKKTLVSISANLDASFAAYFRMRPAISAPRLSEFGELFGFISIRREELDGLSKELARLAQRAREDATIAESSSKTATSIEQELSKINSDASKILATLQAGNTESLKNIKLIETARDSAKQLAEAVTTYKASFEQFQADLEQRNSDYLQKRRSFEALALLLDTESKRIQAISSQAEDMLKGATNAGLAGSYSKKQIDVEYEIRKARLTYYISIGLLIFLTLPIFIYSFPREYVAEAIKHIFNIDIPAILARDTSQSDTQQMLNFIGRAVFLIPGLMFVRFASNRHAQLFRLREDYSYKYSIASSVDGFMKQAKDYAEDMAAASYYELTYNPAEHMDGKSDDARMMNPLFERMLSRLEAKLVKRKPKAAG